MPKSETKNEPSFVVGIGASAGGLEAIEQLFDGLPDDLGIAYVVVQHLSPDFKSLMDELLARWTDMPIHQAESGQRMEADNIYLLPPKKEIAISDGRIILKDKDPGDGLTFPIDHFLRSLAQDAGEKAIGVILSGTGSDGSRGICDIHDVGGLVIVQSEGSAKFNGMPRSAADSGIADLILAPDQIKDALIRYRNIPQASNLTTSFAPPEVNESGLNRVFALIREVYGLDLNQYKANTIIRRTERRILLNKLSHIDQYAELVESDRGELHRLYSDLLIGVTRFFRDPQAFEALENVVAELIDNAQDGSEIRVWTAGCSLGHEAYSLAIVFDELISAQSKSLHVKIFATDIDNEALERAQNGVYSKEDMLDVSDGRIHKHFFAASDAYQVEPRIRQMIVFAPHNLLRDAPFTKIDLIVCRNMLIYMQPKAQKKILSLFHFGLRTRGVLFLGPSETTSEIAEEFETIDSHWKLFRKRRDVRLSPDFRADLSTRTDLRSTGLPHLQQPVLSDNDVIMMSTYDAVLAQVMPPSFLVSEDGELLHTFGDAAEYLKAESGRHTSQLSDRIVDALRPLLSAGIRKAQRDQQMVRFGGIDVSHVDEEAKLVDLCVIPIRESTQNVQSLLIQVSSKAEGTVPLPVEGISTEAFSQEQIVHLEAELNVMKQSLQATIQELETSNEELQATNEEMLASNEELQSTNEELHSVNEELYTVNAEHQNKITQLSEVTRDMDNLLYSTEVHTVFLDRDLQIRKFTPRVADTFSLIPQDIGRRIDSFTSSIQCENLTGKLQRVIRTSESHEEEVCDRSGTWFLMRLLPYRSAMTGNKPNDIEGALLTLVDISKLRATSIALEDSVRKRDQFLAMLSHELRNPLGTIVNATQYVSRFELPQPAAESLAIIRRQSSHMATLLDDLLDVTRVSQGKIHLQKRPFDLLRAVQGALESVRSRCEAREQVIEARLPEAPVWIDGSEPRLLQVVSNLLTNASKYSAPGEKIEISLTVGDDLAEIRVRDHGVGISEEHITNIFEMFVQSDRTLDRADGGLGIGLTLVRSLVDLHDGNIQVYSAGEGRGSEFIVTLPVCHPPSETDDPASPAQTEPTGAKRIVLVEDNIDATKMLAFLLEDAGYQVSIAHDGRRGLELIRSMRPDTAIIDIGLPEISGYDLVRQLRNEVELKDMFVIALTGYGQTSDREEALASGFDEHVVKPVDPDLLNQLVASGKAKRVVSGFHS